MTGETGIPLMRFFIDQGVPDSVGRFLRKRGYEVTLLRECIATNSPDTLVAAVAEANGAVLVALDADFKAITGRTGIGRRRFRTLSLIRFERCRESQAAYRLEKAMSLIEHEWAIGASNRDRRMFIVITADTIRSHR